MRNKKSISLFIFLAGGESEIINGNPLMMAIQLEHREKKRKAK